MAAAIGGSVKIAEAITVVGDVSRVFDPSEDAAIIRSIREDMSDILQICQQKEQSAKDIIRGNLLANVPLPIHRNQPILTRLGNFTTHPRSDPKRRCS
jgi:hypothetical protein